MKRIVVVLMICAMMLSAAACGSTAAQPAAAAEAPAAAQDVESGFLRVAALYDISTMDVAQTTDNYMVPMNIFDRLF